MIRMCRKHKCQVHIVHVASAEALAKIEAAKMKGYPLLLKPVHNIFILMPKTFLMQVQYINVLHPSEKKKIMTN